MRFISWTNTIRPYYLLPSSPMIPPFRTLFLFRSSPMPPIGGSPLRNWQNLNLMQQFGEVGVFSVFKGAAPDSKGLFWRHYDMGAPERTIGEKIRKNLWWLRPQGHYVVDWSHCGVADRLLQATLAEFKPTLIIVAELWTYRYLATLRAYCRATGCKLVLDDHNVEGVLIDEQYAHRPFYGISGKVQKRLNPFQLRSIEGDFLRKVDQVWACSDTDVALFQSTYRLTDRPVMVPNGINLADYEGVRSGQCPLALEPNPHTLIFPATFDYSPNLFAARFLILQLFPRLKARCPDARLLLVGRGPHPLMLEAAAADPQIIVTGQVADVRPYLANASIMVVPLQQGSGTRLKILEAFAAGLPVISTTKGAEGIKAADGEALLIRDGVEPILEAILELWENPDRAQQLTANAYDLVQAGYAWERVGEAIGQAITAL
jgi:polysaccharide biosynthesis protein PslH